MNVGKDIASCLVFLVFREDHSKEGSRHVLSNLAESASFFYVGVDSSYSGACKD